MVNRKDLGPRGEDMAAAFLRGLGMEIVMTGYRYDRAEVDIIARDDDVLVFCEVKARRDDTYGAPEYAMTARKRAQIRKAAEGYLFENGIHQQQCRFDVVAILFHDDREEIRHYKDAFR
jgi:putative endonuclease